MSKEAFTKYTQGGPDGLSLDEVRQALAWGDANPAEALAVSRQHGAQQREADDKEALRAAWEIQGGDPDTFEREFPRLRQEHNAAKLREMDEGAHTRAARSFGRSSKHVFVHQ